MKKKEIPEFKLPRESLGDIPFKLERLKKDSGYDPQSPHRHNYYEIFLYEEGGGNHMIDFQVMEIKKGEIHVLSPGQIHYMIRHPKSAGWVIKFTREFFLLYANDTISRIPFINAPASIPEIRPDSDSFKQMIGYVGKIKDEIQTATQGYHDMIWHYLSLILILCHRNYQNQPMADDSEEVVLSNRFRALLEKEFLSQNTVRFYYEQLLVTSDKLTQVLKATTGKTAGEMISARILLEAKRLLLHSDRSVKEIAYYLNFQDNAYFNRWFKKHEACSPGTFREAARKKYPS